MKKNLERKTINCMIPLRLMGARKMNAFRFKDKMCL